MGWGCFVFVQIPKGMCDGRIRTGVGGEIQGRTKPHLSKMRPMSAICSKSGQKYSGIGEKIQSYRYFGSRIVQKRATASHTSGQCLALMDNRGCMFILVPPFAVGGKLSCQAVRWIRAMRWPGGVAFTSFAMVDNLAQVQASSGSPYGPRVHPLLLSSGGVDGPAPAPWHLLTEAGTPRRASAAPRCCACSAIIAPEPPWVRRGRPGGRSSGSDPGLAALHRLGHAS